MILKYALRTCIVDNDCVVNIVLEEKSMNCNLIPSSYRGLDLYVEEISNNFYFIYTNKSIHVVSNCLDNAILKNKLLLSLPKGCYFRLNEIV